MLRVALLGASGVASNYVASCQRVTGVEVCAIFSRSVERAKQFAQLHGISMATDDLENLLAREDIRAFIIVTEPSRHIELALQAMKHQKHLLIEKPIDADYSKAVELSGRVDDYEAVVSVVSQYRFDPILQKMNRSVVEMSERPLVVDFELFKTRSREYYDSGNGWRQAESDFFCNQGIHWLDVFNWFFGEPIDVQAFSLSGRSGIKCTDRSAAILRYANGSLATISGGSFSRDNPNVRFVVRGNDQTVDYATLTRPPVVQRALNRIIPPSWHHSLSSSSSLDLQVRDFVDAIEFKRQPATTVAQAVLALKLSLTIGGRMNWLDT